MYAEFAEAVRSRLRGPLPGVQAQLQLAPSYRMNSEMARIEGKPCRKAAVLALIYPRDDHLHLLLTVRPEHLTDHPGQIAFPGGGLEGDESLVDAALREAEEEVALDPTRVDILGSLTPLYVPPSNFCVHPFVGFCRDLPPLHPNEDEVHALLHISLEELFASGSITSERWVLHGKEIDVPMYRYASYRIWGATAMMLSELQTVLEDVGPKPTQKL